MGTDALIDYIVVYTLAQVMEKKNTPSFWEMIGSVLPDYQERQKKLKKWIKELKDEILYNFC